MRRGANAFNTIFCKHPLQIKTHSLSRALINSSSLDVVERFDTYENYLDSQLTVADMNYLEDDEMARQLVELGYRGLGDTIRRDVSFCSQPHYPH